MNAFNSVRQFEKELSNYTGAPFVIAVNSCTSALLLVCEYLKVKEVTIPKRTYVSVPMSIIHAGGTVKFEDLEWLGRYQLKPYPIWDSARWITSGMYEPGQYMCLSFHYAKQLALGHGGAILCDDPEADRWFRKARFDGRTEGVAPKDDNIDMIGWNCYMSPKVASDGLMRLHYLPKHNLPMEDDQYSDLSKFKIFQQ